MGVLRDLIANNGAIWLAAGGLVIGIAFGAITAATNFCTMGAISDAVTLGDRRRWRAWLLASATALAGAQLLAWAGVVDLSRSMYLSRTLNPVGNLAGGLMFGLGMVLAGGCPSRNLVRAGSGDLRAVLTLVVLGLFAFMSMGGIFGPARAALEGVTSFALPAPTQSVGDVLGIWLGIASARAAWMTTLALVGLVVAYCFAGAEFRSSPVHVSSGIGVGLVVIAGWALTGLAFDEMALRPVAPISLTYVRPIADALDWLERFTAAPLPGFGVASVFGAILGALGVTLAKGRFRITAFADRGDTLRSLAGAALMGVGGVMALGCTIGQGVTGVSTLAIGSFLTFAAIVLGGSLGVRTLERWLI